MEFFDVREVRQLLLCARKNGINEVYKFLDDIQNLPCLSELIENVILYKVDQISRLVRDNKEVVRFLREANQKEVFSLVLNNEIMSLIFEKLYKDNSMLDKYLENAKILEELGILNVAIKDRKYFVYPFTWEQYISKEKDGKIIKIVKYYTDGDLINIKEAEYNENCIEFSVSKKKPVSYLLKCENSYYGMYRSIYLTDFGFDSSILPEKEELDSYRIPKKLMLK